MAGAARSAGGVAHNAPLPEPRPPNMAARLRRLSVTQIETWMRDPYAIYASEILRLRALDPIDADPGAAERGLFIHDALDRFACGPSPSALPADAERALLALGASPPSATALATAGGARLLVAAFLSASPAGEFVAEERVRRGDLAASHSEIRRQTRSRRPARRFWRFVTAKVDRLDRRRAGGLVLIDYKTGGVPLPKEVAQGFALQLPLEAARSQRGRRGFPGIAAAPIAALAYWRLSGQQQRSAWARRRRWRKTRRRRAR